MKKYICLEETSGQIFQKIKKCMLEIAFSENHEYNNELLEKINY